MAANQKNLLDEMKCSNSKLLYMALHYKKIQHKKFELYAISRLWDRLNDDSIHFVFQQCLYYINEEGSEKRALADLYLPQFNMVVEIDEAHHLNQKEYDEIRSWGLKGQHKVEIRRISFYDENKNLRTAEEVHRQIDGLRDEIQDIKSQKMANGTFKAWTDPYANLNYEYHKTKGFLSVDDNSAFFNAEEVYKIINKGFIQRSHRKLGDNKNIRIWCPKAKDKKWENHVDESFNFVETCNIINGKDRLEKFKGEDRSKQLRAIFLKERGEYGEEHARFVGVFKFHSISDNTVTWERVADRLEFDDEGTVISDLIEVYQKVF